MPQDVKKSLWDHLDELAHRLRVTLFSIVICTLIVSLLPANPNQFLHSGFSEYTSLLSSVMWVIERDLLPEEVKLIAYTWTDTFYIYFLVALTMGTIVSSPITAYELYKFVNPALFPHERKFMYAIVATFSLLFILGVVYAYFLLLPLTFQILMRFVYGVGAMPLFAVGDFFNFVAIGMLASGLFYTFPLVIVMLVKYDIIDPETLAENRRTVFVGVLIVTAVITADPTPLSMFLTSIPFYALFEASIRAGRWIKRRAEKAETIEMGIEASMELLEKEAEKS